MGLKEPILFSETIQLFNEIKYLGLTWKKQLDKVINKAYTLHTMHPVVCHM
jgi:hypothetical protein